MACVTGANSGIGYCVAKSLAEKNATVHMVCRNQARGEEAKNRMLQETGNDDIHLHVVDVSDFRQVGTLTPRLGREGRGMGSLKILMASSSEAVLPVS